jgi:hypothetical protein
MLRGELAHLALEPGAIHRLGLIESKEGRFEL